ncbi:MAG: hypothetical protein JXA87_14545 [Thermoleophilia bacterium]|nr:hypothetical protein [Thermoleophilia bacterium]
MVLRRPVVIGSVLVCICSLLMAGCSSEAVSSTTATQPASTVTADQTTTTAPTTTQRPTTTTLLTTTSTERPTTTEPATTTTLPPLPIVLPGYEKASVRSVSVIMHDTYPAIEGGIELLQPAEKVVAALEAMGLLAVVDGRDCDATLTFELEGHALSAQYSGQGGAFTAYTGAAYAGTVQFEVPGLGSKRWKVSGREECPDHIVYVEGLQKPEEPASAPFYKVLAGPMLVSLSKVWGPEATVDSIGTWEPGWSSGEDWLVGVANEVWPRLLELRLGRGSTRRMNSYAALGVIVARNAVSAEDQSAIVRTLISDLSDPESFARNALFEIDVRRHPGEIYPERDAQAWTEWADANGY